MNSPNARGSVKPSANSPTVMMLMATGDRRWAPRKNTAAPLRRLASSSSSSMRKLVSSSSMPFAPPPRPRSLTFEGLHSLKQLVGGECGPFGEQAANHARERFPRLPLLAHEQVVNVGLDGDRLRCHLCIMHDLCIEVNCSSRSLDA